VLISDGASADVDQVAHALRNEMLQVRIAALHEAIEPPRSGSVMLLWLSVAGWHRVKPTLMAWQTADGIAAPGVIVWLRQGAAELREAVLQTGCDDAISEAISMRELASRVRALHRRLHWRGSPNRLRFGNFRLDLETRSLTCGNQVIALTPTEFALLRVLVRAKGKSLTRGELIDAVWGEETDHETSGRAVDNVVLRLRRKLPNPDVLETVRGIGFRLLPSENATATP
jgi:DNA-binding response OmpR family regulator